MLHPGPKASPAQRGIRFHKKRVYALLGALFLLVYAWLLWAEGQHFFDINENYYLAASRWVSQRRWPYLHYPFIQMPGLPLLYGAVFWLAGITQNYYFWGKFLTVVINAGSLWCIWQLAVRLARCRSLGLAVLALAVTNKNFFRIGWEAANYSLGNLFWLGGLLALVSALPALQPAKEEPRTTTVVAEEDSADAALNKSRLLVAGLLLGLALATKLYFIAGLAPALLATWLYAPQRIKALAWLSAGYLLGLLPALVLFMANPSNFWWNNLGYHFHYNRLLEAQEQHSFLYKLGQNLLYITGNHLAHIPNAVAVAALLLLAIMHRPVLWARRSWFIWLALLLHVAVLLNLSTVFAQYLAIISPLVLLLPAALYRQLFAWQQFYVKALLLVDALCSLLVFGWQHRGTLTFPIESSRKAMARMDSPGQQIANILKEQGKQGTAGPVLTLLPAVAIDGGLEVYPQLTTGNFFYTIADDLPAATRRKLNIVGLKSLDTLLQNQAPAAVLVGWEFPQPGLNEPLRRYARQQRMDSLALPGYEPNDVLMLYFRKKQGMAN